MSSNQYPPMIKNLPQADVPFQGIQGWISQSKDGQVVFFDIEPIGEIPRHSHGEQWGVVIEGAMELTIGDETRRYEAGDSYHIPAGVEHGARFITRVRVIDVFAEPDRWNVRQ